MQKLLKATFIAILVSISVTAQSAPDADELTKLLNDFLWGASKNDIAMHERFWADDLVYTGSGGRRVGKADIIADMRKSPTLSRGSSTRYTAEEVRIQQFGNTAIVAFRLVGTVERHNKTEVTKYLNTGTFLKRNGKWQAVAWQATRMPRPDEAAKREVTAIEAEFHRALLESNVDALEILLDETFAWTRSNGDQVTRQQLLDEIKAGQLKYSKVENTNLTISISGDTAIVRGVSNRQRSAVPNQQADAAPFKAFYTITLVNKAGPWKVVAMHSSRP